MSRKLTVPEMAVGGYKFFKYLTTGGLLNINLEVTKRCNARCGFCDYWNQPAPAELEDYVPVVKKLMPLSVSITGGEPLLRRDLAAVIRALRRNFRFLFISLITNGSLLTVDRGVELWEAGLDQLSISLDYFDERHDRARGLPELTAHILSVIPRLREAGVKMCFNMVIKKGNFKEMPQFLSRAAAMGVNVSLSTYNGWRIDNQSHMISREELPDLDDIIRQLKRLRSRLGNLNTGDYYLERIPTFFSQKRIPGCTAGLNWVQVTPEGMIKRCSDHPAMCHFSQWNRKLFGMTDCSRCWYSCRGAAQEPWTWRRFVQMAKDCLSS